MREATPLRGERQFWITRGQLLALGVTTLSVSVLAFFVGVAVGKGQAPEAPSAEGPAPLVGADLENDALVELLARVEAAAARQIPTANAANLTYPDTLTAPLDLPAPADPLAPPVPEPELPPADPLVTAPADPGAPVAAEPLLGDAPTPPPTLSPPGPRSGWAVQLFSFPDPDAADARIAELEAAGHTAWREEALVKGETRYRVRVGPFGNEEEARAASTELGATFGVDEPLVTALGQ